jgi:pilus assembly protein CpaB
MNRNRLLMGLGVAIAVALIMSAYVYHAFKQAATASSEIATQQIVVAAQQLPLGTKLEPSMLRLMPWPAGQPLEGMHTRIQDCTDRALVIPVTTNEPILESKLAPTAAGSGLAATIPPGMRALTVSVNDVIGVAGFVTPGTMVDVMATGAIPGASGGGQNITRTILENVRVLAVGQKTDQDRGGKPQTAPVITLLLTPQDAAKLAMASTQGKIQLTLRNGMDTDASTPAPVLQTALFASDVPAVAPVVRHAEGRKVAAPPAAPAPYVVEVITGTKRENKSFAEPAQ